MPSSASSCCPPPPAPCTPSAGGSSRERLSGSWDWEGVGEDGEGEEAAACCSCAAAGSAASPCLASTVSALQHTASAASGARTRSLMVAASGLQSGPTPLSRVVVLALLAATDRPSTGQAPQWVKRLSYTLSATLVLSQQPWPAQGSCSQHRNASLLLCSEPRNLDRQHHQTWRPHRIRWTKANWWCQRPKECTSRTCRARGWMPSAAPR